MKISVVDVFCGIGGLSYGFVNEGFDVVAGIDSDESCRYAYETNIGAKFVQADIGDFKKRQIEELYGTRRSKYRVLIGCAPCTPFSIYVGRYRKKRRRNDRWQLLDEFSRLALATMPD